MAVRVRAELVCDDCGAVAPDAFHENGRGLAGRLRAAARAKGWISGTSAELGKYIDLCPACTRPQEAD